MQRSGRCPNTLSSNAADRAEEANDGNPYFLPVGFSIMGGWGTGARLLLHWLGEEADAAYGPCELGEDQWGAARVRVTRLKQPSVEPWRPYLPYGGPK